MSTRRLTPGPGLILPIGLLGFALYFTFAAVQGEYGVLRGVELEAERQVLEAELALLTEEVERMTDRTKRLSDDFLDLDLLDERARAVLGVARTDEIIVE
ncbi:FtsB family cell division protein [Jannaschia seohaensis]|uniref:Cell division protein FtsB n=1 Tax=Jannaschia seohaensis TaxID=475081 RepID=A0A2Y9ANW4_9RHOB|nr:septum formation initiator family protein [Jannaschia seohaensis]PWJ19163.1 cell division protein FtsB [Jannaschia seohaensis]SSA45825.1 Cell division protein FtsB [Jannaschia seohaensis]